jgi:hypothetical protein
MTIPATPKDPMNIAESGRAVNIEPPIGSSEVGLCDTEVAAYRSGAFSRLRRNAGQA